MSRQRAFLGAVCLTAAVLVALGATPAAAVGPVGEEDPSLEATEGQADENCPPSSLEEWLDTGPVCRDGNGDRVEHWVCIVPPHCFDVGWVDEFYLLPPVPSSAGEAVDWASSEAEERQQRTSEDVNRTATTVEDVVEDGDAPDTGGEPGGLVQP